MMFPPVVVEWLHSQFVNRFIKMSTSTGLLTIGELTTQQNPPQISDIALVDLYRLQKVFQNSALEGDIVVEIESRLNDGKTNKQASRGGFSADN
jgi:cysteinyl-tRNA synthetase